jgi:hypothetical protein
MFKIRTIILACIAALFAITLSAVASAGTWDVVKGLWGSIGSGPIFILLGGILAIGVIGLWWDYVCRIAIATGLLIAYAGEAGIDHKFTVDEQEEIKAKFAGLKAAIAAKPKKS